MKLPALILLAASMTSSLIATEIVTQRFTLHHAGDEIVGVIFRPADAAADARLPVVIVEPPWTQVKEQVGTSYGRALAARGYAAVAFDHRHWGESGGTPRQWESPAAKISDLRAVIAHLRTCPDIDADRILGLGVCFGAGYMAAVAAEDKSLRAFATVAAWIHDEPSLRAFFGPEGYALRERTGRDALDKFRTNGEAEMIPAFANDVPLAAMMGPLDYYANPARGAVPAWKNAFAAMSFTEWLAFDAVQPFAPRIKQPVLMIHSDGSALPDNVRKFYAALPGPKELAWTEGSHLDFYDRPGLVNPAAERIVQFFQSLD